MYSPIFFILVLKIKVEPYWNVNFLSITIRLFLFLIKVEPYWNVNSDFTVLFFISLYQSRTILECKYIIDIGFNEVFDIESRTILECKSIYYIWINKKEIL